jgi:hypothetical protein
MCGEARAKKKQTKIKYFADGVSSLLNNKTFVT